MQKMQIFVKHQIYKTMKKLKNNFTTPEQSKRLLELGVPAWTADLYFYEEGCISNDDEPSGVIPYDEVYEDNRKETMFSSSVELPCWSVGRLREIYVIVRGLDISYLPIERGEDMVKYLIRLYEEKAKDMDFSKM